MKLKSNSISMILLLASLTAIGPLSTDMYLASLPSIAQEFSTNSGPAQLTLSVYLIGWAGSMLIVGPVSDRYGRKPVISAGLILYCIASIICVYASSIEVLIILRFLQSIGAAAATVLARTVVRDLFNAEKAARMLSFMGAAMAIVPALAPILGGYFHVLWGWQSNFIFMALIGLISLASVYFLLGETLKQPNLSEINPTSIIKSYYVLLLNRRFVGFTLCCSFSVAGSFAFVSGSSFVLQETYGVPEEYFGYLFGTVVLGFMAGAMVGGNWTTCTSIDEIVKRGVMIVAISGLAMMLLTWFGIQSLFALMIPQVLYYFGVGLVSPQSTVGALSPFPGKAGTASSLFGFFPVLFGAITGALVGHTFNGTQLPMVTIIGVMGLMSLASYFTLISKKGLLTKNNFERDSGDSYE